RAARLELRGEHGARPVRLSRARLLPRLRGPDPPSAVRRRARPGGRAARSDARGMGKHRLPRRRLSDPRDPGSQSPLLAAARQLRPRRRLAGPVPALPGAGRGGVRETGPAGREGGDAYGERRRRGGHVNPILRLYLGLPAPARSLAATLHGWYLRRSRYGSDTERLVAEALERERWSAERWRQWREERLAYVLHRAATRVPYYREWWAARRRKGDRASRELLENWPILDKDAVQNHPLAFVAEDCDVRRSTARQPNDDRGSWELLENWPILEKDTLRDNPRAFVADDCDVRRMFREQT